MSWAVLRGDARQLPLADESVQCVVTSPPYWGLRNYGVDGQLGIEPTPEAYVEQMVAVFREVRRALKPDGTLWLNLGDSYAGGGRGGYGDGTEKQHTNKGSLIAAPKWGPTGLKAKDLVGIPWRLAFALQADGWWLRSDIIWAKKNCMPESVTDRPTRAHEYIFLMTKSSSYFYNADAIATSPAQSSIDRLAQPTLQEQNGSGRANGGAKTNGPMRAVFGGRNKHQGYGNRKHSGREDEGRYLDNGVNARTVWHMSVQPFKGAHFATFPEELAERCVLAGSKEGSLVLDPFAGSGTVGVVTLRHGRRFVGLELNETYCQMARRRIMADAPLLNR